jgi:hypothetical protein
MRQLLILGFYCEVYRREPLCRIYVNDMLVDEFNIAQCYQVQAKVDPLDPSYNEKRLQHFITNPPFLKCIEFDDAGADSLDVVLRIQNDDNNYANGFMSKYTYIVLSDIYLISKKVLENIDSIVNYYKFNRKNWRKYNANTIDYYAYSHRPELIENFTRYAACNFPDIRLESNQGINAHRIGTSGSFHLSLVKKLGFWRTGNSNFKGVWGLGRDNIVKYIYDKYKNYEDTRTTDQ